MGSAIGASLLATGHRVITTVAGRSSRSATFAKDAGIELVPDVDALVGAADVILSVVPPESAMQVASTIAESAARLDRRPVVAELNAVSPATVSAVAAVLGDLELIDGSISGPPPRPGTETRIYLSGPGHDVLSELAAPGIRWRPVGVEIGTASAVKMCTASVYKGITALLAHALLTAERHGVTEHVLADISGSVPHGVARSVLAATKAWRYVGEMEQIAATQAEAGLTPALFEGIAEVYRELATSEWGSRQPEDIPGSPDPATALRDLRPN
jgi:3-hydroxyisobutyrate dehydrogenase-like beta-hydroxyacid dehydrogenase